MRFLVGFILAVTWPGMWIMGGQCVLPGSEQGVAVLCVGSPVGCVNLLAPGACPESPTSSCLRTSAPDPMEPADRGTPCPEPEPCQIVCCEGRPRLAQSVGPLAAGGAPLAVQDVLEPPCVLPIDLWLPAEMPPPGALEGRLRRHRESAAQRRAVLCVWLN